MRSEVGEVRTLSLQTVEYARRIERRVNEVERRVNEVERRVSEQRDDLELMIKAELSGGLGPYAEPARNHLRPIHDRLMGLDRLEARVSALENRTT